MAGNMEGPTGKPARKLLGEELVEAGIIDREKLQQALVHQRKVGRRLGTCLVDLRLVSEPQIVNALARKFNCAVVEVASLDRTPAVASAMELMTVDMALQNHCLPVAADKGTLTVAMADPTNFALLDDLSFRVGRRVSVRIAGEREIDAAVRRLYAFEPLERTGQSVRLQPVEPSPATQQEPGPETSTSWNSDAVVAALTRVMVRRGLVTELELVAELERRA